MKFITHLFGSTMVVLLVFVLGFGQTKLDKNDFGYAPPKLVAADKLTLWSTYYYVHEAKYAEKGLPLNDAKGKPTGVRLANCDWCDAAIEGTVRTFDKSGNAVTLNYAKTGTDQQCDCNATCAKYANYKKKSVTRSGLRPEANMATALTDLN